MCLYGFTFQVPYRLLCRGGGSPRPLPRLSPFPQTPPIPHYPPPQKTGHRFSHRRLIKLLNFPKLSYFAAVFPFTLPSPQKHRTLPNFRRARVYVCLYGFTFQVPYRLLCRGGGSPRPLPRLSPFPQTPPIPHYPSPQKTGH